MSAQSKCQHSKWITWDGRRRCEACDYEPAANPASGLLEMEDAYHEYINNTNPADASPYRCFKAAWNARDEEVKRLTDRLQLEERAVELLKSYGERIDAENEWLRDALIELFKRWDDLGINKDDDFGKVEEIMEQLRPLALADKGDT